ncbi:MAG TPA: NAD(P)/FAD-dependent oxidoreductase [Candidatus Acidoferrales bacterium]|nr:NAD(P)/FAD-dependent oxidoreductase [Candidatus Acidoferrales bacterium]
MPNQHKFDVVIVGAGAAGLMCAIEAGRRARRVAVLERADRIGKKILISGGGRCNFTNLNCRAENFISSNPHFAKSALARYTPTDFIAMVERHRIAYHEKTLGQLFCDGSAQQIVDMLARECERVGVRVFTRIDVRDVRRTDEFVLNCGEEEFRAPALVIATGGLSIPKMGATGWGYDIARQFGMKVRECRPALVPLTFGENDMRCFSDLAGVSAEVVAAADHASFREKMLFTHRGLSGPAILQASSYWKHGGTLRIDLAPGVEITKAFRDPNQRRDQAALRTLLRSALPNRLADRWVDLNAPSRWNNSALEEFERQIHSWHVTPTGTEGFDKAEVTAGGVDTDGLSAKTMESRTVPGLYFVGEVVDVTGQLGGYNFQWAWASGYSAGQAV